MFFNSKQFLSYLIVGLFAVIVYFIVYIVLKDFVDLDLSISKRVSYISGAVISFFSIKN